jgi:hypothetical protein
VDCTKILGKDNKDPRKEKAKRDEGNGLNFTPFPFPESSNHPKYLVLSSNYAHNDKSGEALNLVSRH